MQKFLKARNTRFQPKKITSRFQLTKDSNSTLLRITKGDWKQEITSKRIMADMAKNFSKAPKMVKAKDEDSNDSVLRNAMKIG